VFERLCALRFSLHPPIVFVSFYLFADSDSRDPERQLCAFERSAEFGSKGAFVMVFGPCNRKKKRFFDQEKRRENPSDQSLVESLTKSEFF